MKIENFRAPEKIRVCVRRESERRPTFVELMGYYLSFFKKAIIFLKI